jgi:hypothetical protein
MMASNNAFKITKDTSARKNTRVGSIQSAVEAAAMKESHDYYVDRLTEGYKQQLETMEQGYEEQIRGLKSQLVAIAEKTKKDAIAEAAAVAAVKARSADARLKEETNKYEQLRLAHMHTEKRAVRAERENISLESGYRAQFSEQFKKHAAELDKAQREKTSGPYQWIEIKLTKRFKSKMAAPKLVVRRSGMKFSELFQAALGSKSIDFWSFEYHGRPLTDIEKTLTQVSPCASACGMGCGAMLTNV